MFKFVPGAVRHAWWPVSWTAADEDGQILTHTIEMRFVLQDDAEYQTLTTDTAAEFDARWKPLSGVERQAAQGRARAEYLQRFATGWRGVTDENDAPLPFATEILAPFVLQPGVMSAVLQAHAAARLGARPNG